MKRILVCGAAALAATLLGSSAFAAPLTFTVSSLLSGDDVEFTLDSNAIPDGVSSDSFYYVNQSITQNGVTTVQPFLEFYDTRDGGGFYFGSDRTNPLFGVAGTVLYTGSLSSPTFAPGVFGETNFGEAPDTVTISSAISAAPEPAAWALLVLAVGMIGGVLRVRRRAASFAAT